MIPQLNVTLMLVCLGVFVPMSAGQSVSELTIDGMPTIIENTSRNYKAVACLDDGTEQDVTAMTDWWMVYHAEARIDEQGRLTAGEVDEDQSITIWASFTNGRITRHAARQVRIVNVAADEGQDPWPEWQRTGSRLGRTSTIGPETPTIAWGIMVDPTDVDTDVIPRSPVMDAQGRIFVGNQYGITAVDSATHEILWQFLDSDSVDYAPSVRNGRVLFGTPDDFFYCLDAATGELIWSVPAEPHPNLTPVTSPDGIVYYASQLNRVYARSIVDGSEVWTHKHPVPFQSHPALDGLGQLYIGNSGLAQWVAFDTSDGTINWSFQMGSSGLGASPVEDGRVYVSSSDDNLYCIDAASGGEIWQFFGDKPSAGAGPIRDDGVVYLLVSDGSTGWLFAVSPDGKELWRYGFTNEMRGLPPIVDGAGTAYFCTFDSQLDLGHVRAVRFDGTELWVKEMPDRVAGSPMLAPDGTLYVVCRDKYLYAFKDPDVLGDLDGNGSVGAADLLALLASWGTCPDLPETCPADLDLNGNVGAADLLILLANWG